MRGEGGRSAHNSTPNNVIEARQWQRNRDTPSTRPKIPRRANGEGVRPATADRMRSQRLLPSSSSSEANLPAARSRTDLSRQPPRRRIRVGPHLRGRMPISSRTPAFSNRSPRLRQPAAPSGSGLSRVSSRDQLLPVLPSRQATQITRYERPIKRLNPRPVATATRPRPTRKVRNPRKPASPLVYATRLLILGVGIGAIAGTLISVFDPAARYGGGVANPALTAAGAQATSDQASDSALSRTVLNPSQSGQWADFGRRPSLLTALQLGQELTQLAAVIRADATIEPDLTPGLFLVDLDSGAYVNLNGTRRFASASMIKVPILVAFFQDVDAGKIRFNDLFTMQEEDVAGGSGDMQFDDVGSEYSAIDVATMMITISDNTATNILIRELGGAEALNQRFQSWGMSGTQVRNLLPDLAGTNTTTPRELVELMVFVSQGDLISLRSRDRLLEIMRGTVTDTLLPAGIAPDATIAHKTGDIGSLVGDVGIIDMPDGKRYAIAAMVQRPHNDDRAQELIRQMSRTVYDYLEDPQQFQPSGLASDRSLNRLSPNAAPSSSYEDVPDDLDSDLWSD